MNSDTMLILTAQFFTMAIVVENPTMLILAFFSMVAFGIIAKRENRIEHLIQERIKEYEERNKKKR